MPFFQGTALAACLTAACTISPLGNVPAGTAALTGIRATDTAQITAAARPASGTALPVSSFRAADAGPGISALSSGDNYAQYQWGLKNNGDLRMVEIRDRFAYGGSAYTPTENGPHVGLPIPNEPGNYEVLTTDAVAGIDINIAPAWDLYDGSDTNRDVIVAVIDTGVDIVHPDLKNSIWTNGGEIPGDGIDNDGNGYVDDYFGWDFFYNDPSVFSGGSSEDTHGTHVAGTIAAGRGNGGMAGITGSEHVKIMTLKALGTSQGVGTPEDVIAAIRYAEANGASICNLSFCSNAYTQELADTIRDSSMLFVVAAGNGDANGIGYSIDTTPTYPASLPFDNIITVSNLMFDGNLDTSSNYGALSADIAAPGTYIVSTIPGRYGFLSGTSMAAPMVTGAAALLYSYRPDFTVLDVKDALLQSARKLDTLTGRVSTGGMLDVGAAFGWQKAAQ